MEKYFIKKFKNFEFRFWELWFLDFININPNIIATNFEYRYYIFFIGNIVIDFTLNKH